MKKMTSDEFIEKAQKIHGNKYDYSLVDYKNNKTKIKIICLKHGIFEQKPNNHLIGQKCIYCSGKKYLLNDFLIKAKKIHGNKYDYSLINLKNNKIEIICLKHGIFKQTITNHLNNKQGCSICFGNKKLVYNEFIEKAQLIHGNKYDYSLVDYKNFTTKVKIICPEHGVFEQIPKSHLYKHGCILCNESSGEKIIANLLNLKNIFYKRQYTFNNCKNINLLPFDFYLPNNRICIEYDGIQHFKPINYFGGIKTYMYIKNNDDIKTQYCLNNNIQLLRISYKDNIILKINNVFL